MTRRRSIAIGAASVVVLLVVAGLWWLLDRDSGAEPGPGASNSAPEAADAAPADRAAVALEALESDPAALLPASLDGEVDIAAAFPDGTEVEADPSTWAESSVGGGVIQVTLTFPDGTDEVLAAVMVQEGEDWVVLQTLPWQEAK